MKRRAAGCGSGRRPPPTGEIVQITQGRTGHSGWAIWCERHLRGIYNHLSALNQSNGEVYYFQGEELRAVSVESLGDRAIASLEGRVPVGRSAFSPDGRHRGVLRGPRAQCGVRPHGL